MHAHIHARINKIQNGEVPQGYRKTRVGIIPNDWNIKPMGSFVFISSGESPVNFNLSGKGDYPYVKVEDLNNCSKFQRYSRTYSNESKSLISIGSIIFPKRGAAILNNKVRIAAVPLQMDSNLMALTPDERIVSGEFFYYKICQEKLSRIADTSTIPQINNKHIVPYKIPLPPIPEQRKIAEILSAWDDAIRLQHELIEQKNTQKRGLMQLLLTGAIRVTEMGRVSADALKQRVADIRHGIVPEGYRKIQWAILPKAWSFLKIKNIAQQVIEFNSNNAIQKVLSCTKHGGLVDSLSYFKRQVFSEDLSKYKIVRRGHFAYATNHIEEGSIGLQNICDAGLVSPMYTVFKTQPSMLAEFLYAVLKTETYRKIFEVQTSASINRRGSLRWNQFSQIRVPVPAVEEQSKIVDILATADKEIELLEAELERLRAQKTGLMQLLLTGAIRVHEGAGHNSGFEEKTD